MGKIKKIFILLLIVFCSCLFFIEFPVMKFYIQNRMYDGDFEIQNETFFFVYKYFITYRLNSSQVDINKKYKKIFDISNIPEINSQRKIVQFGIYINGDNIERIVNILENDNTEFKVEYYCDKKIIWKEVKSFKTNVVNFETGKNYLYIGGSNGLDYETLRRVSQIKVEYNPGLRASKLENLKFMFSVKIGNSSL